MELKAARLQAKLSRLQKKTSDSSETRATRIQEAIREEFGDKAIVTVKEAPVGPVKRAQVRRGEIVDRNKNKVNGDTKAAAPAPLPKKDMSYSFVGTDGDSTVSPATKANTGVLFAIAHPGKVSTDGMLYSFIGDEAVSPDTQTKSSLLLALAGNAEEPTQAPVEEDQMYSYVGDSDVNPEILAKSNAFMHVMPAENPEDHLDAMVYSFVGDDSETTDMSPATQANSAVFIALTQPNQPKINNTAYYITVTQPEDDDMEYSFIGDSDISPSTQANSAVFIALTSQAEDDEEGDDCQVYSFIAPDGDSTISPATQANSSVFIAMAPPAEGGQSDQSPTKDMAYSFVGNSEDISPATQANQSILLAMANANTEETGTPYTFITMDGDGETSPWTQANSSVFMALSSQ